MSIFILIAFGFGNLAMLGWLGAAAAPLLIHLWSRHRYREAPWAAMQFLLAALRKNARRMQFQQWLLLAVRTLIIALIVLAVAEPYGELLLAGGGSEPTHKVIVIDGSYSMAYRDGNATRFDRAKQMASALVEGSRPADTFTVILMADSAKTILGREVVDQSAVVKQIESLAQPQAGADLGGTISLVQEAISPKNDDRNTAAQAEVYFFTDLQRTTWATIPGSHALGGNLTPGRSRGAISTAATQSVEISRSNADRENEELDDQIAKIAAQAAIAVIDLGQPRSANLAVTNVITTEPIVTVGRESTFEVTLRQFDHEPRRKCEVELLIDDVPVAEQTVDIPADGDVTLRFAHRFASPGEYRIAVRAAADQLTIDDARWLVVPVREEIRVLCVAGRDGAAKYIASALNPNPASESPIRPVVVSEADLAELELADFDCIFICNVAQLTLQEAERLRRYAAAGGGIVFFLGDQVVPESYNVLANSSVNPQSQIPNPQSPAALLPARIGEIVTTAQYGLDPLEYRHPIVAPFRGQERAGLVTTPVNRYFRLEVAKPVANSEIAVAMPNGAPFIVTAPFGRGRTILVATDGSITSVDATSGEPWTQWPTWPSFLPMIRELLAFATSGRHHEWQQSVGTPLTGRDVAAGAATTQSKPVTLQIERPDGRKATVAVQQSTNGLEWAFADTDLSGIYTLVGLPDDESQHFAVNVDTAESDLAKVDPQQLPSGLLVRDSWRAATDDSDLEPVNTHLVPTAWQQLLLWAALAFLFVEPFMAWQFGRGAA